MKGNLTAYLERILQ